MMRFIEHLEEYYEVQEVPFGRSYTWCPECVVVECDCGVELTFKMSDLTGVGAVCACGADLTTDIQEKLQGHQPEVRGQGLKDDETTQHPWRHDAEAQAEQHLRDEATHADGSPWRYNDVRHRSLQEERDVQ
jgi:hypothetical protein